MTFYCTYCGQGIEPPSLSISVMQCPKCQSEVTVPSFSSKRSEAFRTNEAVPGILPDQTPQSDRELVGWIRRTLMGVLLLCLSLGAITGIIALLSREIGEIKIRILMTTLSLGVYSATGLCCLAVSELRPWSWFGRIGVVLSMAAALFAIATNWLDFRDAKTIFQFRFVGLIIAIAFAHASLLMRISLYSVAASLVRWATFLCIAMFASISIYFVMDPKGIIDVWPIFGILGILCVLGTLATVILRFAAPVPRS